MLETIENLECLDEKHNSKIAVVILHGYGANCHDLWPVKDFIQNKDNFDWYFPNAPLEIPIAFHMMGRAWFPITMSEFEKALNEGNFENVFEDKLPDGFTKACELVLLFIKELKKSYEKIYIGGFSQGSMIATHVTLQYPEFIHKLFVLSGTLVSQKNWKNWAHQIKQVPTFQSHGKNDPVLPFSQAKKLNDIFHGKPNHQFHEFDGGHEIPPHILAKLSEFIND